MKIKRLSGALGAEISDVDLTQALSADLVADIRAVFLDAGVIFIKNQALTSQQFLDFANKMGEPVAYPFVKGFDDFPQIIEVKKAGARTGQLWWYLAFRHHLFR